MGVNEMLMVSRSEKDMAVSNLDVEVKNELDHLKETNATLQVDNDQLKAENATLLTKTTDLTELIEESKKNTEEPTRQTSKSQKDADKKSMTFKQRSTFAISDEKPMALKE